MPQETHIVSGESVNDGAPAAFTDLRAHAEQLAKCSPWQPNVRSSDWIVKRREALAESLAPVLAEFRGPLHHAPVSDDVHWLHDNVHLLYSELHATNDIVKTMSKIPHVFTPGKETVPRPAVVAQGFLEAANYEFSEAAFVVYVNAFQETTVLDVKELWALVACLRMLLLEEVAVRGARVAADKQSVHGVGICVRSLREVTQTSWTEIIEPLIVFDRVLMQDPVGAYPRMDFDSRELYRNKIVRIAERCDLSELEVANLALSLAREAERDIASDGNNADRLKERRSHIGYYLVAEGRDALNEQAGFRPTLWLRLQNFLRRHPDEFYVPGVALLSFAIMSIIVLLLTSRESPPVLIFLAFLVLLLPSSQGAVQLMNDLVTSVLPAEILPKLKLADEIPQNCVTLVAIPTLLLNEKQVQRLIDDLEVRFLRQS